MRKKISPAVVLAWLLLIVSLSMTVFVYSLGDSARKVHGDAIRVEVFEINSVTGAVSALLEEQSASAAGFATCAGRISSCKTAFRMNEDFTALCGAYEAALAEYASALESGGFSAGALALLKGDAEFYNTAVHSTVQYIMAGLNSTDTKKMNKNYYDACVSTGDFSLRLSTVVENHLAGR